MHSVPRSMHFCVHSSAVPGQSRNKSVEEPSHCVPSYFVKYTSAKSNSKTSVFSECWSHTQMASSAMFLEFFLTFHIEESSRYTNVETVELKSTTDQTLPESGSVVLYSVLSISTVAIKPPTPPVSLHATCNMVDGVTSSIVNTKGMCQNAPES